LEATSWTNAGGSGWFVTTVRRMRCPNVDKPGGASLSG
jgi:hypothetical protein